MNDRFLRTGVFLAPFHALNENPTLAIERDMDLLVHLDKLNYHEAWVGEHHSGGFEIIACPEMFIAAAAERTRHIRLGTRVVSLPYHNPFLLADRMVQLDQLHIPLDRQRRVLVQSVERSQENAGPEVAILHGVCLSARVG